MEMSRTLVFTFDIVEGKRHGRLGTIDFVPRLCCRPSTVLNVNVEVGEMSMGLGSLMLVWCGELSGLMSLRCRGGLV